MSRLISGLRLVTIIMKRINAGAAFFGGLLVFCYMFLVTANISGRYFFNKPIDGTMEIGQIVLASIIFFNLAYAQMERAHIRVTAVLERLPAAWRDRIETATLAVGFLVMAMLAWRSVPFAMDSFILREAHMSVDVPIWPTKMIFCIGWSMFAIQFFLEFLARLLPEAATEIADHPRRS